jgi:hypothetical protein
LLSARFLACGHEPMHHTPANINTRSFLQRSWRPSSPLIGPSLKSERPRHLGNLIRKVTFAAAQRQYLIRLRDLDQKVVRGNPKALEYAGLQTMSLSLSGIRPGTGVAHVNLVLPELSPASLFAGLKTALDAAYAVAEIRNLPLRIVVFGVAISPSNRKIVARLLESRGRPSGAAVEIIAIEATAATEFSSSDIWIATYWTTAHALDVACKLGIVDPGRVMYLIQDYEPGFFPWSTDYAVAMSTYASGFVPIVNSVPLRDYIEANAGIDVPLGSTFRPQLDLRQLERAATLRLATDRPKILFYGRPSKPRNMFKLGIAAMRAASSKLDSLGLDVAFESVGEAHGAVALPTGREVGVLGKMAWDDYFTQLASADVFFSLQASPHPSHPPLDAVTSGGFAVMNELGGTRAHIHPRLQAGRPDPESLANDLVDSVQSAMMSSASTMFDPRFLVSLGATLPDAVQNAALNIDA